MYVHVPIQYFKHFPHVSHIVQSLKLHSSIFHICLLNVARMLGGITSAVVSPVNDRMKVPWVRWSGQWRLDVFQ